MRLWTLHPACLDGKGLVAGWREALLAQKVLAGETRGYTRHPQLERFREAPDPQAAMTVFLQGLLEEADRRGYHFDATRILPLDPTLAASPGTAQTAAQEVPRIAVAEGQIRYEAEFLLTKLQDRTPEAMPPLQEALRRDDIPLHPLFTPVPGPIASWEKVRSTS